MANSTAPDPARRSPPGRAELLHQLEMAGRASSAATILFHTVVAERLGLSATQEKVIDLVGREGPLTAGTLAKRAGLKPATITGLLDALEAKGFVQRVPNPEDRRSVLVEVDDEHVLSAFAPLYSDWIAELSELYAGYSDEQLRTILHFLTEAADRQQRATASLTDDHHRPA